MFEGLELRARDDTVQNACTYEPYGAVVSVKLTCADSSSGSTKTEKEQMYYQTYGHAPKAYLVQLYL